MDLIEKGYGKLARSHLERGLSLSESMQLLGNMCPGLAQDEIFQQMYPEVFTLEVLKTGLKENNSSTTDTTTERNNDFAKES